MGKSAVFREFLRYSTLSILGMLGVSCYILADTFFISRGLGTAGLAALNLAIPVFNFIHGAGIMLGLGGATRFSISQGREDRAGCRQAFTDAFWPGAGFALLFFLLGALAPGPLAKLLGADSQTLEMATTYLRWLLLFAPVFLLNNLLLCFIRNDSRPQLAMAAQLIGSFSNILLDWLFIFPLDLGMFGAILATCLSPVISITVMAPHWAGGKCSFLPLDSCPALHGVLRTMSLGLPALIGQLSGAVVMILFNFLILGMAGNTGLAAYGVIANIALVVTAIYSGLAQGIQPQVSRFHGSGHPQMGRQVLRYALVIMVLASALLYTVLYAGAQPIAGMFNSENSPLLQVIAVEGLRLYFLSCPFTGFNTILSVYLPSVERDRAAQVLSLLRSLALLAPLAILLAQLWGMTGLWLAFPLTEGLTALAGWFAHACKSRRERV